MGRNKSPLFYSLDEPFKAQEDTRLNEPITIRLTKEMRKALELKKENQGKDFSEILRRLIQDNIIQKRGDENEMQKSCLL